MSSLFRFAGRTIASCIRSGTRKPGGRSTMCCRCQSLGSCGSKHIRTLSPPNQFSSRALRLSRMSEDPPLFSERQIQIDTWKEQARLHWKEFRPSLYRDLEKLGRLDEALTDAA